MIKSLVLDTNILYGDFNLRSNDLRKLIKICSLYSVDVCIPQIVLDECLGQYECEFLKALNEYKKSHENLQRVLLDRYDNRYNISDFIKSISERKEFYCHQLEKFIKDKSIKVLPYPDISHQEVVKWMYGLKHPFTENSKERGYKDFLLAKAVVESLCSDKTVIYTKNIKDFSSTFESKNLNLIHSDYLSENCYVSDNLTLIIQSLHDNHQGFKEVDVNIDDLNTFLDLMVSNILDDILLRDELFGDLMFEPNINKRTVFNQIIGNPTVEKDSGIKTFTFSGEIRIQFDCSFKMNSFEFEMLNKSFVFYSEIEAAVKNKGRDIDSGWEYNFHDVHYNEVFEFSYDTFEGNDKPLVEYDEFALTLYRKVV